MPRGSEVHVRGEEIDAAGQVLDAEFSGRDREVGKGRALPFFKGKDASIHVARIDRPPSLHA
jgi:hypothetical protein